MNTFLFAEDASATVARFVTEAEQRLRPAYLMDGLDEVERLERRLLDAGLSPDEAERLARNPDSTELEVAA